jgi:type VI protein secretion system component VasF
MFAVRMYVCLQVGHEGATRVVAQVLLSQHRAWVQHGPMPLQVILPVAILAILLLFLSLSLSLSDTRTRIHTHTYTQ